MAVVADRIQEAPVIVKDLGDGWTIHDDGGDVELREDDQVVAFVRFDQNVLTIPAFGRLGSRDISLTHLSELFFAAGQASGRERTRQS